MEDRTPLLCNPVSLNSSSVVAGPTTTLLQQLAEALQQLNATYNTYKQYVSSTELRPE